MKKIILIVLICSPFANVRSQTNNPIEHLHAIFKNKGAFVGKPFSNLLDSLQAPIVFFTSAGAKHSDISQENETRFYFIDPKSPDEFKCRYLSVSWQQPLDAHASLIIFKKTDSGGAWIQEAKDFYKNAVIKDISASEDIKKFVKITMND